jgi:N-acylneuraminate cytidylyltransferase/CMP-N,N'-diacetyllegionaminic acid synthase
MVDVVLHALDTLAVAGREFDVVILLQPTSPLRATADIEGALERLTQTGGRAVVSVCPAEHSPLLAGTLPPDGSLTGFLRERDAVSNRQELPAYHRLNGAVYVAEVSFLREGGTFVGDASFAYIMPAERSIDIDSELDCEIAECLLQRSRT